MQRDHKAFLLKNRSDFQEVSSGMFVEDVSVNAYFRIDPVLYDQRQVSFFEQPIRDAHLNSSYDIFKHSPVYCFFLFDLNSLRCCALIFPS